MAKKPKPGSRQSQARVDSALRGEEAKGKALRRTVKDKATGALVYPSKDYQAYVKASQAAGKAGVEHMTPQKVESYRAKRKKGKPMGGK